MRLFQIGPLLDHPPLQERLRAAEGTIRRSALELLQLVEGGFQIGLAAELSARARAVGSAPSRSQRRAALLHLLGGLPP